MLRVDDSMENTTFDGPIKYGPIKYGHSEEDAKHNLFYYQTPQANEVFAAVDSQQREQTSVIKAPNGQSSADPGRRGPHLWHSSW